MPNIDANRTLRDVRAAFQAVPPRGDLFEVDGKSPTVFGVLESHVQGVARNHRFLCFSHSNKGASRGFLIFADATSGKVEVVLSTPEQADGLNHPSGIQACGDYLAVPLENISGHNRSAVAIYDLEAVSGTNTQPIQLGIREDGRKAGGLGFARVFGADQRAVHLIATYDGGVVQFYRSNGEQLTSSSLAWTCVGRARVDDGGKGTGPDSIQLVVEDSGALFLIAAGAEGDTRDWARLFSVPWPFTETDLHAGVEAKNIPSLPMIEKRHMVTRHHAPPASLFSPEVALNPAMWGTALATARVHFRFGFGIDVTSPTSMDFWATQMNFLEGVLWTNRFPSPRAPALPLAILVHLAESGDRWGHDRETVGTTGQARAMQGFQIAFHPAVPGLELEYHAHLEGTGDTTPAHGGDFVGTRNQSRRVEGFAISLVGPRSRDYDVLYTAHVQDVGWVPLCSNGAYCGTRDRSLRVEAIQVMVTPKVSF